MIGRRDFLVTGGLVAATGLAARAHAQGHDHGATGTEGAPVDDAARTASPPGTRAASEAATRTITPNGLTLAPREVGGVKVFHLVAEEIEHEFLPGVRALCWGYNGRTPGPTLEATEGDRVRIYVTNHLPEPTSVHWHGFLLPSGMDGVGGLSHPPIPVGATYRYDFALRQSGTLMYHSHFDEMVQIALGLSGMFVVHPRVERGPRIDRDFAIMLNEWEVVPGARRPNPLAMLDFNVFTFNGKAFPATEPLVVRRGQRVRIRFGNPGPTDHHPIHLHGHHFTVVGTDGGAVPTSARRPETTVLVPVGTTRDVELVADAPGDWALHCHMTHHMMNQMGHEMPNTVGADARPIDRYVRRQVPGFMTMGQSGMAGMSAMDMPVPANSAPMRGAAGRHGPIDMGGMLAILKVRERLATFDDPGWYENPEGTVARAATAAELAEDGIDVD